MRALFLMLPTLLSACTWISVAEIEDREDPDGDGVRLSDDCAPHDPANSALSAAYTDADGDGLGDPDAPVSVCGQTEGTVTNGDDCNDDDAGWTSPATVYDDLDGDGHGDPDAPRSVCADTEGVAEVADDCDDEDASRYPGAEERCQDGVVNDCDGGAEAAWQTCGLSEAEAVEEDALAALSGDASDGRAGYAVADGGDVNGDGQPDLLVAGPGSATAVGTVWWVAGPALGELSLASAGVALTGEAGQLAGLGLSDAADLDGDGYSDLLIGGPARTSYDGGGCGVGHAWLVRGPLDGAMALSEADGIFESVTGTDCMGHGVGLGGDLTGDGQADLLVGAPSLNDGAHVGTAWLVSGADALADADLGAAAVALTGESGRLGGYRVLGADLDGDGVSEAVVGAQGSTGSVFVLAGPITGEQDLSDGVELASSETNSKAGSATAAPGDLDGDGLADLIVGARYSALNGTESGAAFVMSGGFSFNATLQDDATATLLGAADHDHAGVTVGGLGDIDQDGTGDVFVGAPECDLGATDGGAVFLARGPLEGQIPLSDVPAVLAGTTSYGWLGRGAARVGDVNSDGINDLLLGGPGHDDGDVTGSAWLWPVEGY